MKTLHIIWFVLLSISIFTSCEKEIDFDGETTESQLVLNSFITPDSTIAANISESQFFLNNDYLFKAVENAEVSIYCNGILKETMQHSLNGKYISATKPEVGDIVKLVVKVPEKEEISGETTIYPKANVLKLDSIVIWTGAKPIIETVNTVDNGLPKTETIVVGKYRFRTIRYILTFEDAANMKNYYRLVVSQTSSFEGKKKVNYDYTLDDIVSGNTKDLLPGIPAINESKNQFHVFTDELINGKTYPLSFTIRDTASIYLPEYQRPLPKKTVEIDLQSVCNNFYLFLKTRSDQQTASPLFSEPIQIFNNVNGGIGLVGSYTSNVVKVTL
ncbi:MAG: DUF4249 domain-containing protein [Paludibacter sp.]|nr:DUF4249 domain-containing protein [Paludibacter sp.]